MAFNALLMCQEQRSLRVLAAALDELEIEREVCLSAAEATELMVQRPYSALVLDFDLPDAALLTRLARLVPPHRRPVIFAMIGALTGIVGTFRAGANFVFYKPLALGKGRGFLGLGEVSCNQNARW